MSPLRDAEGRRRPLLTGAGGREASLLIVLSLVAAAAWAFVALGWAVAEGRTEALDTRLLLALRTPGNPADPLGPRWLEELMRDVTALGGLAVLSLVAGVAALYLLLARRWRAALGLIAAVAGSVVLSTLLKQAYGRPRPSLVPHEVFVYSASFPSGHSLMSAAGYLSLAALLARREPRRVLRGSIHGAALTIIVLVGASRVYLGVHYPTDVLAGWAVGSAWAGTCWLAVQLAGRDGPRAPGP